MTLPRLLVLTDRTQCGSPGSPAGSTAGSAAGLVAAVATAVDHGARAVVLREKDLPPDERAALARALRTLLDPVAGLLIVAAGDGPDGVESLVDGVHLSAAVPFPSARPSIVGRSCHDAAELARAAAQGCDYVTLSPVFPSPSKPGYGPALGPAGLAALIRPAGPLVYALGGVTPDRAAACRAAGAHGVAVMGAVMRDPALVAGYLSALATPESTSEDT